MGKGDREPRVQSARPYDDKNMGNYKNMNYLSSTQITIKFAFKFKPPGIYDLMAGCSNCPKQPRVRLKTKKNNETNKQLYL